MNSTMRRNLCIQTALLSLMFLGAFQCSVYASESKERAATDETKEEEALRIGTDAYIFGYPLVTMEMTRRVLTNVEKPEGNYAPMGQFAHLRNYPDPSDKAVTTPNADTLYSFAWLDLSKEPYVLTIPDSNGRYYLMPMLDGWTTVFANPGTRATGTGSQRYVITGPRWTKNIPGDFTQCKSATNMVWLIGRTYCNGSPEDFNKVHAFQDQFSLVPLSVYGKEYSPPAGKTNPDVDMKTAVRDQVNHLDALTYFKLLADLMIDNPPTKADSPFVSKMAKIGIVPGKEFDPERLSPATKKALEGVPKVAQEKIMADKANAGKITNGWNFIKKTGTYGTDYLERAFVTAVGLGANRPEDAVYPGADVDADGKPLDGTKKYTLHFEKDQIPPVEAFWSITMYDDNYFFVPNALNRYDLASRSPLKYNADGSLDLYFQNKWPGRDKQANWLQTPDGKFNLILRMYWPKLEVIEAKYNVPPVRCVE